VLQVWQEFWITGDNNGRGTDPPSDPTWPLDHSLFLECAKDTIKLLRNYASLALWVGGNEQHPASDLNAALEDCLQLHPHFQFPIKTTGLDWLPKSVDPSVYLDGSRIYIQGSLWDGFAEGNGTLTDGPYGIQNPEDFFKDSFYSYGFNPEVGSVGVPVAATVKATMPKEAWKIPDFVKQENGFIEEVPNPTWQYHKFLPYSCPGKVQDQIESYGEPKDLDDFCLKVV
jgi:mannosylglycoprotein endo-beta-mannosidase